MHKINGPSKSGVLLFEQDPEENGRRGENNHENM